MKFAVAFLSLLSGAVASTIEVGASMKANSKAGKGLIGNARRLDQGDDAAEVDMSWAMDYSIKFQGCHHVSQYNAEAGDDGVMIETQRLIRFRLCPANTCSDSSGYGCSSGYGDYIVDMDTYVESYLENKEQIQEATCEAAEENCGCENNGDDAYDEEACLNTCFANQGLSYCIEDEDGFELNDYLACAQYNPPEAQNQYYRKLEEAAEEAEYYLGPYCADQGGEIHLGLFTDDTCTNFADDYGYGGKTTFEKISYGKSLPYSSKSIVDSDCYSCKEEPEYYDQYDQGELKEFCEQTYEVAGKCETKLGSDYPNESACTYLEGIKMTRKNGIIISGAGSKNKVASAFIGIFACSFILLGAYVYYLKTKLDRGTINLSD